MSEQFMLSVRVTVPDDQLFWFIEEPGNWLASNSFDEVIDELPCTPLSFSEKLRKLEEEM